MSIQQYQALVSDAIAKLDWNRAPQGLYHPIAYALSVGGKHLRPAMMLMTADMYGADINKIMPAALAVEIFHNFTLLHDDIMDHAAKRRGQATVQKKFGENTAILSGDQMLISAYQMLEKTDNALLPELFHVFSDMAEKVCQGQQYDMEFENQYDVIIADYINMITLKTAALIATSLQIGAMLANAPEEHRKELYNYGINLGIAFQLRDDYLDLYATSTAFGKTQGSDVLNNKKTYLLIQAMNMAKGDIKNQLEYWLQPAQGKDQQAKIQAVKEIFDKLQIPQLTLEAIKKYTDKALETLEALPIEADKKADMLQLTNNLLKRNK